MSKTFDNGAWSAASEQAVNVVDPIYDKWCASASSSTAGHVLSKEEAMPCARSSWSKGDLNADIVGQSGLQDIAEMAGIKVPA
jgi:hypothetical protein